MKPDDLHREFRRQVRLAAVEADPAYRREVAGLVRRLYPVDASRLGAVIESPEGLGESDAAIEAAIARQAAMFRERRQSVEWRTYGDDPPRDLPDRLRRAGFDVGATQILMLGATRVFAGDRVVPQGVRLREVVEADWDRLHQAFDDGSPTGAAWTLQALRTELTMLRGSLQMALAEDRVTREVLAVSAVRYFVGSQFAQVTGGLSRTEARGQGISRALAADRAALARDAGYPFIRLDVPPDLQPSLSRRGLHGVTTTTTCRLVLRAASQGARRGR